MDEVSKHIADVTITWELLRQMIYFPVDTKLLRVSSENRADGGMDIVLRVEQQDLRAVSEDEAVPHAAPQLMRYEPAVKFLGWGQ